MNLLATEQMLIWDYQPHFRASVQKAAEEVFGELEAGLLPHVQVLGIAVPDWGTDVVPVICEPAGELDVALFADLLDVSAQFEQDGEILLYRRHLKEDTGDFNRYPRVLCCEIERRVRPLNERTVAFCSYPVFIDGYLVAVVLHLDRQAYASHHGDTALEATRSLLSATTLEFLNACSKALTEANPGSKPLVLGREADELVAAAANTLTHKLTYELRQWGYPLSLFEACNEISALMYEGDEGVGTMLVAEPDDSGIEVAVKLKRKVRLSDYRHARKMLEMATNRVSLLCDGGYIYGLGSVRDDSPRAHHVLRVDFIKHYDWELSLDGKSIMRVHYRRPTLSAKPINEQRFRGVVRKIFLDMSLEEEERLWDIALETTQQHRGTLLIVSDGAKEEAERLENQGIQVQPFLLRPEIVHTITAIDGAVLLSPTGMCYAIGVILDGLATDRETPTRGARYNSAIRYIETMKHNWASLAVVVSKDGMIDLVWDDRAPLISTGDGASSRLAGFRR